jgi:hypothetical protein
MNISDLINFERSSKLKNSEIFMVKNTHPSQFQRGELIIEFGIEFH